MTRKHVSHSQISTFLKCGEQYRLQKIAHAPQVPAGWLMSGTAFHTSIEQYERSDRTLSASDLVDIYEKTFDDEVLAGLEIEPDMSRWLRGRGSAEDDIRKRRGLGPEWISGYLDYLAGSSFKLYELPDGSPAVEVPFFLGLDTRHGRVEIRGFIDQIIQWPDGSVMPRDLKTGTKPPGNQLQLGVYAVALFELFGERAELGDYFMAKKGKIDGPHPLTMYDRPFLSRCFGDFVRAKELGLFIPNPTADNCRPCGVQRYCYAGGGLDWEEYPPIPHDLDLKEDDGTPNTVIRTDADEAQALVTPT